MDQSVQLKTVITSDSSQAKEDIQGFDSSLKEIGVIAAGIALEQLAEKFLQLGETIAQVAIESSANLENISIAARTAFGSGGASEQMLNSLNDLAAATPFVNTQLDQVAIRLQNMGVPTKNIQNDLKNLSNIAAGTGTTFADMSGILSSTGDALSVAFQRGTVSAIQLRGIANQGIPIYQALVDVINAQGGAFDQSAKSAQKDAKAIADAKQNHIDLTKSIQDAQIQLGLMVRQFGDNTIADQQYNLTVQKSKDGLQALQDQLTKNTESLARYTAVGITSGTQFQALASTHESLVKKIQNAQDALTIMIKKHNDTGLASDQHTFAIQKQKEAIDKLKQSLLENDKTLTDTAQKSKISVADLLSNSKEITITSDQLETALAKLGQGKYADAAKAQANSFNGTMKNLQQTFEETIDKILGVSQAGEITNGGIFDQLKIAAMDLLNFLNANQGAIVAFAQNVIQSFEKQITPAITRAFQYLLIHRDEIIGSIAAAGLNFVKLAGFVITVVVPAIVTMIGWLTKNRETLTNLAISIGVVATAAAIAFAVFNPWVAVVGALVAAFTWILNHMDQIRDFFNNIGASVGRTATSFNIPHFATGVSNFGGGMALVGEQGAELVNLPKGSSVTPARQTSQMMGGTVNIYNPVVRSDNDITQIVNQVKQALGRQNELARLGAI